ncbi:MAG: GNAT family N-acetyltransferase, partial [Flavobacteriales bacterium]
MSTESPSFPLSVEELAEDVYFSSEWLELDMLHSADAEDRSEFSYQEGSGFFRERTVKHRIEEVGGSSVKEPLYDLQSPYGLSGPLTNAEDPGFVRRAYRTYEEKALEEGVVASFIRFHPFDPFPYIFSEELDLCAHERNVVHIPFEGGMEEVFANFKSSLRRNIRKGLKEELHFHVSEKGATDREAFIDLYRRTMRRIGAPSSYLFTDHYFQKLFDAPYSGLFLLKDGEKVVNGLLMLKSGPMLYYHLGGTDPDHYTRNV